MNYSLETCGSHRFHGWDIIDAAWEYLMRHKHRGDDAHVPSWIVKSLMGEIERLRVKLAEHGSRAAR